MQKITQEQTQSLFNYKNGFLYWKVNRTANKVKGNKAGSIDNKGYYKIQINNKQYFNHRLIYLYHYGYIPKQIDHIDNNPLNNNIENLRESTQLQNCMNRKSNKNSTSKFKGVCWHKVSNKWIANIRINGKLKHLGYFKSEIQAAKAYNKAAMKYFKEFAYLNEVE